MRVEKRDGELYLKREVVVYFDDQVIKEKHKDKSEFVVIVVPRYKAKGPTTLYKTLLDYMEVHNDDERKGRS